MKKIRTCLAVLGLGALLLLSACGNDDSTGGTDTASDTTGTSDGADTGEPPGGLDSGQLEEIQECLEAAGLEDALPTDRPEGMPSDLPSDLPSDFPTDMPSDFPTDMPSDLPSDFAGGSAGMLQDPEIQEALEACGIDLPRAPAQS